MKKKLFVGLVLVSFAFSQNALQDVKEALSSARTDLKVAKEDLEYVKKKLDELERRFDEHLKFHQSILAKVKEKLEEEVVKEKEEAVKGKKIFSLYKVMPCDTLWGISSKVYKNPYYWPSIYNLNKRKIGKDPWIIRVGMILRYKTRLSALEKRKAFKEAVYWDRKFKNRPRSPLCPPEYRKKLKR